jgi:hypothetical protein
MTMIAKFFSDNIKSILALTTVVLSIVYFFMCSLRNIKPDPQILIAMVSANAQVLSYYFGSSSKGNDKPLATTESGNVTVKP